MVYMLYFDINKPARATLSGFKIKMGIIMFFRAEQSKALNHCKKFYCTIQNFKT